MISVGANLTDAIEAQNVVAQVLLSIEFASDDIVRLTDAPRDLTISGDTYSRSSTIISLTPPKVRSDVDRDVYTIAFSDNDQDWRGRFAAKTGVGLVVRMVFVNNDHSLVTEQLNVYQGYSSAIQYGRDGEEGFKTTVQFTGQLAQLASANVRLTSQRSQQAIDFSDTSMDYVHDSARNDTLRWGR